MFTQARSDLASFLALSGQARCQQLHYLQMAGEKVAKAYSSEAARNVPPALSHYGFSRWLRTVSLPQAAIFDLGYKSQQDFRRAIDSLKNTVDALEHLAPKIANDRAKGLVPSSLWPGLGTNAEYPWVVGGDVQAPADYAFPESPLREAKLTKVFSFLDVLVSRELQTSRLR